MRLMRRISYTNEHVDHEKEKLNRNAYNALRRSLLWNNCLQIKTFTNQNLSVSWNFWKDAYVNKETLKISDIVY